MGAQQTCCHRTVDRDVLIAIKLFPISRSESAIHLLLLHFHPQKLAHLARLNRHGRTTPFEVALVA